MRELKLAVLGVALAVVVAVVAVTRVSPVGAAGTWTIVASPDAAGATRSNLTAMSCPAATNCIAVGSSTAGTITHSLTEQYNGTGWTIVASADVVGASVTRLTAVSCRTTTSCIAVGLSTTGTTTRTLTERYNGTGWAIVASANPAGATASSLAGVSCPATNNCIATGSATIGAATRTLTERYNGTGWAIVASANPAGASRASLPAVTCSSTTSCIAVGYATIGSTTRTLGERYNGTGWAIVASANPPSVAVARFTSVSCAALTNCIGVGVSTVGTTSRTLTEKYNGTSWAIVASPNPAGAMLSSLAGVTCAATTTCIAVGSATTGSTARTLTEKYNGTSWAIVASPNPPSATVAGLSTLRCQNTTTCVAVGSATVGSVGHTLSEKYNDTSSTGTLFADQFNGSQLDTTQWTAMNRPGDSSNSEAQCYKPSNVVEGGGSLVITTKSDTSCNGFSYTSGMIQWTTFNFTYGTVEVRAKLAGGQGPWPAVWLLGHNCQASNIVSATNHPPCNWPQVGSEEIDILEGKNGDTSTVNEGLFAQGGNFGTCGPPVADTTQWHTYDLIWAQGSITWKIDGTTTCHMTSGVPSTPMFLIINTALGGVGGGTITPSDLPQTTSIDYVTVTR